jgi:hypothetical protein
MEFFWDKDSHWFQPNSKKPRSQEATERRTPNAERRTPNAERRTPNAETPKRRNAETPKRRTPNAD